MREGQPEAGASGGGSTNEKTPCCLQAVQRGQDSVGPLQQRSFLIPSNGKKWAAVSLSVVEKLVGRSFTQPKKSQDSCDLQ